MNYAIIETGGKQYVVSPGSRIKIERLPDSKNLINFDEVLLVADSNKISIGKPYLEGAQVTAERLNDGKSKKVIVSRYHSKTRYRKKKGHRQPFTEILIKEIK